MDVFDLTAKIALDTSEYESSLGKAKKSASGTADTLKKVAKVVAGSAVVKGFADMTKASTDAYSSFEQLAGGAKKIFDAMDVSKIFLDADRAYQDLGMSANQYLAVINDVGASFSATMGDAKGYETAKTGLQAISDYASGTGKNINELSQKFTLITKSTSSYQSIADQFSGILPATTDEFLKQAQAAGFLSESYETLTDVPIAEYQEAVARILEKGTAALGLAGNTAMEAATTISGSAQMAKAAWENWLVAVADPTQDLDAKTEALVDSVIAVADNAVPRVLTIVPRFASAIYNSSDAVSALIDAVELAGTVMAGQFAGKSIMSVIKGFQTAKVHVEAFAAANDLATTKNAIMTGQLTVGQTVVGLLTGKIKLATAAQATWNGVMAANPIGIFIAALGGAVVIANKSRNAIKSHAEELAGMATTSDEASATLESLKKRLDEIGETNPNKMTIEQRKEYSALNQAIQMVEGQYDSLIAKEQEAAAATQGTTDAVAAEAERLQAFTQSFADDVNALLEDYQNTYTSILSGVQGWFAPFETAKVTVKTSIDEMMAAMASQIEFNQNYEANLSTLAEMGLGSLATAFQELGPEGAAYAQAIVDSVEKAGGATSEGGKQIIDSFTTLNTDLINAESGLSETMTTMSGKYDAALSDLVKSTQESIADMDFKDEASKSAASTLQGYLDGLNSNKGSIFTVLDEIRRKAEETLNAVNSVKSAGGSVGGYATGLNYVPYDDFPALLHRGEAVLTAPEARAWRNGDSHVPAAAGAPIIINQYIQSVPQTPADIAAATEAYFEQARWML